MRKYRRVEINAYRRRVTIVSGEWSRDGFSEPSKSTYGGSRNDTNSCNPVEPDSPEGQLMLVEAVSSLERRISPNARQLISAGEEALASNRRTLKRLYNWLRSFFMQEFCTYLATKILRRSNQSKTDSA